MKKSLTLLLVYLLAFGFSAYASSGHEGQKPKAVEKVVKTAPIQIKPVHIESAAPEFEQIVRHSFKTELTQKKKSRLSVQEKLALKLMSNKLEKAGIEKLEVKQTIKDVKSGKKAMADLTGLLYTLGVIFIIIGVLDILLNFLTQGAAGTSWIIIGVILILVAKFIL